jgi:type IV pilus assembly protein PilM
MPFQVFKFAKSQRVLGIDIGAFAIKIVELSKEGEKVKLENYGFLESKFLYEKPFRIFEENVLTLSTSDIAFAITSILKEAKITTKIANFSLPDFSSFFTTFSLPPMGKDEIASAVNFEARQHVPLPISELALDWISIGPNELQGRQKEIKILLVAIPKRVVEQYQQIANLANLQLKNLEAEVFSLTRSLIPNKEGTFCLVDIGAESTTCSIIEKGALSISHSFNTSGNDLTKELANQLNLDLGKAEQLKLKYGLSLEGKAIAKVLQSVLDSIIIETERIIKHFHQKEGKIVEKIILTGGTANLKGVQEYFKEKLKKEVEIGNPFSKIIYPQLLDKKLKELGPALAIALGVGLGTFS